MSKNIDDALKKLEKRFGEPVFQKMGSAKSNAETFSTGRLDLDAKLGGGWGVGKIIEIYSEEGCGKTGLALEAIASIQALGGVSAIVDAENALNTEYCKQLNINIEDLYISQPSFGEQAFEAIRALIKSGDVDLIVVDSVSSMIPRAELEGESGEAKIGLHARLMSQGCKMITGIANETGCTVIFINQLRDKITSFGTQKVTSGGNALKFYASQRIELKKKLIKESDSIIGFTQHIKIVKNKLGIPYKTLDNDIIFGKGVDKLSGKIDALIEHKIITRVSNWYKYKEKNIAQGAKKLRILLEDDENLLKEMLNDLQNQ